MRSRFVQAAAMVATCAACGSGETASPALAPRANVILIVIDTLRADHLGTWGAARPTSPRIDALGREALVVDRMVAQASWTKPSMASLFTSLFPSQHQAVEEATDNHLSRSLTTLAECFREAGYVTMGISENPHVSPSTGFDQGFDELTTLTGFLGDRAWVVESARAWLERFAAKGSERPFFLYLHFLDPHGPYQPESAWRDEFLAGLEAQRAEVRQGLVGQLVEGARPSAPIADGEVDYLRALYDAEIRETDEALATLLGELERRDLLSDSVLLLTADHGEEFLEHGTLKHGYQLFEETLRVPLLLRVPGQQARRASNAVVQHIDLAPTLLELVGLPIPAQFQGQSLVPLFSGGDLQARPVVSETSWRGIDLAAARLGDWKLIEDRQTGERRLFDLASDPGERVDLRAGHPDLVERLAATIELVCRPLPDLEMHGLSGPRDAEAERALQALGYFGK